MGNPDYKAKITSDQWGVIIPEGEKPKIIRASERGAYPAEATWMPGDRVGEELKNNPNGKKLTPSISPLIKKFEQHTHAHFSARKLSDEEAQHIFHETMDDIVGQDTLTARLIRFALQDPSLHVYLIPDDVQGYYPYSKFEPCPGLCDDREGHNAVYINVGNTADPLKDPVSREEIKWLLCEELLHHAMKKLYRNQCEVYPLDDNRRLSILEKTIRNDRDLAREALGKIPKFEQGPINVDKTFDREARRIRERFQQDFEFPAGMYEWKDIYYELPVKVLTLQALGKWENDALWNHYDHKKSELQPGETFASRYPNLESYVKTIIGEDFAAFEKTGDLPTHALGKLKKIGAKKMSLVKTAAQAGAAETMPHALMFPLSPEPTAGDGVPRFTDLRRQNEFEFLLEALGEGVPQDDKKEDNFLPVFRRLNEQYKLHLSKEEIGALGGVVYPVLSHTHRFLGSPKTPESRRGDTALHSLFALLHLHHDVWMPLGLHHDAKMAPVGRAIARDLISHDIGETFGEFATYEQVGLHDEDKVDIERMIVSFVLTVAFAYGSTQNKAQIEEGKALLQHVRTDVQKMVEESKNTLHRGKPHDIVPSEIDVEALQLLLKKHLDHNDTLKKAAMKHKAVIEGWLTHFDIVEGKGTYAGHPRGPVSKLFERIQGNSQVTRVQESLHEALIAPTVSHDTQRKPYLPKDAVPLAWLSPYQTLAGIRYQERTLGSVFESLDNMPAGEMKDKWTQVCKQIRKYAYETTIRKLRISPEHYQLEKLVPENEEPIKGWVPKFNRRYPQEGKRWTIPGDKGNEHWAYLAKYHEQGRQGSVVTREEMIKMYEMAIEQDWTPPKGQALFDVPDYIQQVRNAERSRRAISR